ncbi:MAG: redox-sensing transcriptional repressor Rex [Spirochaetaceae bacterium]|nr:redox-sensing transcriptional repressor Rex [Spirochaetaceae bacterium]
MEKKKVTAAPSVRRLPSYLNIIRDVQEEGEDYISGTRIAQELNLESIQVRKDLAITGILGKPRKGYLIEPLITAIEYYLGWNNIQDAALVGVGNLGSALLGYQAFNLHGLNIMAAFDNDRKKIGATIHGVRIMNAGSLDIQIRNFGIKIAILTVPSSYAQETADILVKSGIEGIWNFTNRKLIVPENVVVQKEDLSSGFAMLCIKMRNNIK